RAAKQWVAFYSERTAWATRDMKQFMAGLERNGPRAVAEYQRMLEANRAARAAPSDDVGPRIPGNYYKTDNEPAKR
ncbi:MAG TPA: deiodinase-related protein, partial [Myxococcaceae bacterium]|nr:deiodinase-related protein [Myxococcaceae bacterium]